MPDPKNREVVNELIERSDNDEQKVTEEVKKLMIDPLLKGTDPDDLFTRAEELQQYADRFDTKEKKKSFSCRPLFRCLFFCCVNSKEEADYKQVKTLLSVKPPGGP